MDGQEAEGLVAEWKMVEGGEEADLEKAFRRLRVVPLARDPRLLTKLSNFHHGGHQWLVFDGARSGKRPWGVNSSGLRRGGSPRRW